ncbi:unnamed protein product [Amoebophrya sp. A25]|nr:unnamed protein product [Amoebophrya sp. A25]|eukprot:GSA25T00025585001.1
MAFLVNSELPAVPLAFRLSWCPRLPPHFSSRSIMVPYTVATLSEVLCLGSYATDKRFWRREALRNNGPVDEGQALMGYHPKGPVCKLNALLSPSKEPFTFYLLPVDDTEKPRAFYVKRPIYQEVDYGVSGLCFRNPFLSSNYMKMLLLVLHLLTYIDITSESDTTSAQVVSSKYSSRGTTAGEKR